MDGMELSSIHRLSCFSSLCGMRDSIPKGAECLFFWHIPIPPFVIARLIVWFRRLCSILMPGLGWRLTTAHIMERSISRAYVDCAWCRPGDREWWNPSNREIYMMEKLFTLMSNFRNHIYEFLFETGNGTRHLLPASSTERSAYCERFAAGNDQWDDAEWSLELCLIDSSFISYFISTSKLHLRWNKLKRFQWDRWMHYCVNSACMTSLVSPQIVITFGVNYSISKLIYFANDLRLISRENLENSRHNLNPRMAA